MRAVNAPVPSRQVSIQLSLQAHYRQPKGQGVHSNAVAIPTAATRSTHVESLQKKKSHIHTSSMTKKLATQISPFRHFSIRVSRSQARSCYENQNNSQPCNLLNLKMQVTKVSYWVDIDILPFHRVKHLLNANSTIYSPLLQLIIIQPFRPRSYNMWKQKIKTATLCLACIVSMVDAIESMSNQVLMTCISFATMKYGRKKQPATLNLAHIDTMVIERCQWINVKPNVDDMCL